MSGQSSSILLMNQDWPNQGKHVSPKKFGLSIKDMLQIEPRNSQRKHTPGALLVPETPESIIAGPVFFMSGIVSNYRLQITYFISLRIPRTQYDRTVILPKIKIVA